MPTTACGARAAEARRALPRPAAGQGPQRRGQTRAPARPSLAPSHLSPPSPRLARRLLSRLAARVRCAWDVGFGGERRVRKSRERVCVRAWVGGECAVAGERSRESWERVLTEGVDGFPIYSSMSFDIRPHSLIHSLPTPCSVPLHCAPPSFPRPHARPPLRSTSCSPLNPASRARLARPATHINPTPNPRRVRGVHPCLRGITLTRHLFRVLLLCACGR